MILHIVCSDIFVARNLFDDCWMATTLINSFMIGEGGSQPLRCYHLTICWRNDPAGEIDSTVKSSLFMGAQKLECEPEKNNISLLSNAIHRTAQTAKIYRFEWISWAAIWNWVCNLCKRSFMEGQAQNENIKLWCGRLCHFLAHIIWQNSGHDHTLVKSLLNMNFFFELLNLPP